MAVLCLQTVVVGEGLAQDDVVEHLDDPDAAAVGLMGEEGEHVHVLLEGLVVYLQGEGIVLQFHQRGKGMSVPEVERVVFVFYHHVEVLHPFCLVVEPGEVLGSIGIFVDAVAGQIDCLLQTYAGAAHHHSWCFLDGLWRWHRNILNETAGLSDAVCQLHAAIDDTRGIVTNDLDTFLVLGEGVPFGSTTVSVRQHDVVVGLLAGDRTAHLLQLLLQVLCRILLTC